MKVISQYEINELNAGPKAKVDVERILNKEYNAKVKTLKIRNNIHQKVNLFFFRIRKALFILFNRNIKDTVIYNLPYNKNGKYSIRAKNAIGLIHDLNGIRDLDDHLLDVEIDHLKHYDVLISHNDTMTKVLIDKGIKSPIINLELFDYIVSDSPKNNKRKNNTIKEIVFAGNLSKAAFLNDLDDTKMNFKLNLFGVGDFNKNNKKYKYFGSFLPDELPLHMDGDLGLVWDGHADSENSKNDRFLNYTKYNNPHKLSCYIAAGLPVIVWEKAACAKFVKKENIGYTISNLYDINNLDFSDYDKKLKNIKKIQERVINGKYTIDAINKALDIINKGSK